MFSPHVNLPLRTPKYPLGFVARYLRHFAWKKMDAAQWRQYELAEWLGIPDHALSTYLKRHAIPPPERLARLVELGCDEKALFEAATADRLELWMRTHGIGVEEVRAALDRIEYQRRVIDEVIGLP